MNASRNARRLIIRAKLAQMMMTGKQLARVAGISASHCYNLISGVSESRPGRQRIEDALGVKIWPEIKGHVSGAVAANRNEPGVK